jgi:hypothetical protein
MNMISGQRIDKLKVFKFNCVENLKNFLQMIENELHEILDRGIMPKDKWQEFFLEQFILSVCETFETEGKQFSILNLQNEMNDKIVILCPIESFLMKINDVDVAIKTNSKVVEIIDIRIPCRYRNYCTRKECWYIHTQSETVNQCRYGNYCTRLNCWYNHPGFEQPRICEEC